jgi:hypothetical protein
MSSKKDAKAKPEATKAKKEKKERGPKEHYLPLANSGNPDIRQHVQHIRGTGVLVTTSFLNAKGEVVGGSTNWIPGIKPKSKKGDRFLVIDKGPKPKKDKKAKEEKKK